MTTKYVIAGNIKKFDAYVMAHVEDGIHYAWVYHPSVIDNIVMKNPDGVFIGTWYKHPNIYQILIDLMIVCDNTTKREIVKTMLMKYFDSRDRTHS
jgi:hypothetical protein